MEKIPPLESVATLRKATVADVPVLLELEKSVSGTRTYSTGLGESGGEEYLKSNAVYIIEIDNVPVGNISYEIKSDDNAYISDLVVDPRFQSRGIARESLTRVLDELKDYKRIDLVTHPDNKAAIGLYQSLGFVIESRKENYFGDGEPRLVLALQK